MMMLGGGGEVVRVQALAESGVANVPSQFIQPPEKRPGPGGHSPDSPDFPDSPDSGVPVIDLSDWDAAREEVGRACRDWGGFQVRNHGVCIGLLDQMRKAGLHFFRECSMEEKLRYSCDPHSPASEGYGSRMVVDKEEAVLDWRDYLDHHTFPISRRDPNRWPQFLPNYRELVAEYSDEMKKLALKLLSLISESLGLPSSCILDKVGGDEEEEMYQNITVSYYPPCPTPDLTLGLQPHSDMGALTLLIQDHVGGLQLLHHHHNTWVTVPPLSDAILVLLADQTEIISNGQYRSPPHRALTNSHHPRLSVAAFHDPSKARYISPAPQLLSKDCPPRYREVLYGDYVSSWYTKGPEGKRNIHALLI